MRKRTSRRSQSQYRHQSKASSRPPPTGLLPGARLVRAFPFLVERSTSIAQPSSLNIRLRAHLMFVTLGLSTRKKTLFDNGVNAPISVHHLGHPEVDGEADLAIIGIGRGPRSSSVTAMTRPSRTLSAFA